MALAVVAGLAIALLRLYAIAPLRWLAKAYVEIIRGTPLLIQLFLIYYGLPEIGIRLNPFLAGVMGLGLNYAASEAEIPGINGTRVAEAIREQGQAVEFVSAMPQLGLALRKAMRSEK